MSLLDRLHAQDCAVVGCTRHRVEDALFCTVHLNDMWGRRLDRQPDGTFTPRRQFVARDESKRSAA